ncbi:Trm112 family protein [candidate division KSB1 bacterium]|nr:Trm112 family protein [candidate division KSB1 bacterium]
MPVDKKLVEILCCPKTRVPVKLLTAEIREKANKLIRENAAVYSDGSPLDQELTEGLITQDGKTIYRVDDGIPIMIIEKGIPTDQFKNL